MWGMHVLDGLQAVHDQCDIQLSVGIVHAHQRPRAVWLIRQHQQHDADVATSS